MISPALPRQASRCNAFQVFDGQPVQLPDHEVHYIIGVAYGVNAIEVPRPSRIAMVEREQALFSERREELNGEKRIASRLFINELCQRGSALRLTVQRIRNQLIN